MTDTTRRRVIFIDHIPELSGGEIALLTLVRHLDRSHWSALVVLAAEGPFAESLREHGVDVEVLPLSHQTRHRGKGSGWRLFLDLRLGLELIGYALRLSRLLRRERAALVHTNSLKADIYGGMAARLAGVPCVWHLRDRVDRDYLSLPLLRLFRWTLRWMPAHLICNSLATANSVEGVGSAPRTVIASGVSLPDPERLAHLPHPDRARPTIGMVGRIAPWKGQREFVEVAALMAARLPRAEFWIAGAALFAGDRAYADEVRLQVEVLGLSDRIRFLGFVRDVYPVMSALDVVVHASVIAEPLGKVLLEAMAVGRPVVATDLGGAREVVVQGRTGILVPPRQPEAMADAIELLLLHPEVADRMGREGQARVAALFEAGATTRQVERVYESVLRVPARVSPG
ncbi:MAG: glycosyltransferase [Candidatus Dormibacteria bacterium]